MRARLPENPPAQAGLALQRYLKAVGDDGKSARVLLESIQDSQVFGEYKLFFERWKGSLEGALFLEATTRAPLAIGLGNKTPLENGLAIHHTYGVPYLPGSALKGLARRVAPKQLSEEDSRVLFGSAESAGFIVFWDGWLDPAYQKPFQKDVITVHHPGYYKGGQAWPTDFDDPNPVAFLSVRPGVKFHLALSSPDLKATSWLYLAAELLCYGLKHLGLGGKTNTGYGYFGNIKIIVPERPKTLQEQGQELLNRSLPTIQQIEKAQDLSKADQLAAELKGLAPAIRRPTLEALRSHLQSIRQWNLEKKRCQEIQALLEET